MQLDSSRNHIMHYNLWLSMVSVSVMAATLLPCFFGESGEGRRGREGGACRALLGALLLLRVLRPSFSTHPKNTRTKKPAHAQTKPPTKTEGMNLDSGMSTAEPGNFYAVAASSVGVAALSFPIARAAFLRHWRRVSAREMSEQKLLR